MVKPVAQTRQRVGLALGGGAVRGLAHIGVLSVLEREQIPISCVAGSSVGSLIGAAYCSGIGMQRLVDLAQQTVWRDLANITFSTKGFLTFAKMERWLVSVLGDLDFSDLKIPFSAVATDLPSGDSVILREGSLASAVRASCSVPGIIQPIRINGRVLVDGGVSDNLPVRAARALGAEYVIGVDVCRPRNSWRRGAAGIALGALEVLVRGAGGGVSAADCLISPDLAGFSYVRFSKRQELIALGISAAEKRLPQLRAALAVPLRCQQAI